MAREAITSPQSMVVCARIASLTDESRGTRHRVAAKCFKTLLERAICDRRNGPDSKAA